MRRNSAGGPPRWRRRLGMRSFWDGGLPEGARIIDVDEGLNDEYLDEAYLNAFGDWPVATKKERSQSVISLLDENGNGAADNGDSTGEVDNPSASTKSPRSQTAVISLLDESDNDSDSDDDGANNVAGDGEAAHNEDGLGEINNKNMKSQDVINLSDDESDDESDDDSDSDKELTTVRATSRALLAKRTREGTRMTKVVMMTATIAKTTTMTRVAMIVRLESYVSLSTEHEGHKKHMGFISELRRGKARRARELELDWSTARLRVEHLPHPLSSWEE